jgi:hypothetical protein
VSAKSEKGREQMNIATVVSFDGSSKSALKIVMLRIDGSTVTTTTLASITRDGMNFIRTHGLNEMFENSGVKEIAAMMATGDDQQPRRE